MNKHILVSLVVFLIIPLSLARAERPCDEALDHQLLRIQDPFWSKDSPILVNTGGDTQGPLTYSFDIEIGDDEIYPRLLKDENLSRRFHSEAKLESLSVHGAATTLKMSEKQFRAFALKKNVETPGEYFYADQIHSRYLKALWPTKFYQVRIDAVTQWLAAFPIETSMDGKNVEIRHSSYDATPAVYKSNIEKLQSAINRPQSHFHLGIPSSALNIRQFMAIARAMETRAILRLVAEDPTSQQPLSYTFSFLPDAGLTEKLVGMRGIIKAQLNAFNSHGLLFHDLELREWSSTEQAMNEIKRAIEMVQAADRIRILPGQKNAKGAFIVDPITQNLKGALEYAGLALSYSKDPQTTAIASHLTELSNQLSTEHEPSVELKEKVAAYINKSEILELLSTEAFLHE